MEHQRSSFTFRNSGNHANLLISLVSVGAHCNVDIYYDAIPRISWCPLIERKLFDQVAEVFEVGWKNILYLKYISKVMSLANTKKSSLWISAI
jgi:hypothetical protein